ncbi:PREDICTED: uncharacterized protein LOC104824273 isoform X2 [Tarenaya hassleriana]|uniref:uncharacterized protein LOC104824273 isoform X2 n=1 Tax=Tarenaya hassleriana TaxID=28532 RepID=UPI00053C3E2C|nr:PREDICTED: uncharacterized protein LOC104824273 isoform X2 [Tarenaya hassleriana]
MGMDLRVMTAGERGWGRGSGGGGGGGFSHDGEHDLGLMVRDFLETGGGSGGGDSWCSSDSDSGCPDLSSLSDKIQFLKNSMAPYEADVLSAVSSQMFAIREKDLHSVKSGTCNASCIRFYLAKLLRLAGYNAAVCSARWQLSGKVPGGDHEYIDVILTDTGVGQDKRLIVDTDFRSHFEIARAVDSYHKVMDSLPVVYVGTVTKLKQFLQVMVEAAKYSLKQNSMPLPPWRSLHYLQSKWHSPYKRHLGPIDLDGPEMFSEGLHKQCAENLKRLQLALQSEREGERLAKPIMSSGKSGWRMKPERTRNHTGRRRGN